MYHLQKVVDPEVLGRHIDAGLISAKSDVDLGITVFNYTKAAEKLWQWDDTLKACRGLGLDSQTGEVVFRGPRKFFQIDQDPNSIECSLNWLKQWGAPEITEKLDGALGLGFIRNGRIWISTRGSTKSEIAREATEIVRWKYPDIRWPEGFTPYFEILTERTRQVVDYGDLHDITWLGMVENRTGREMRHKDVAPYARKYGVPMVRLYSESAEHCLAETEQNREGYVFSYWDDQNHVHRVKVKFADYIEATRILKYLTPLKLWSMLKDNQEAKLNELISTLPVHIQLIVCGWRDHMLSVFQREADLVESLFQSRPHPELSIEDLRQPENEAKLRDVLDYIKPFVGGGAVLNKLTGKRKWSYKVDMGPQYVYDIWDSIRPQGKSVLAQEDEC